MNFLKSRIALEAIAENEEALEEKPQNTPDGENSEPADAGTETAAIDGEGGATDETNAPTNVEQDPETDVNADGASEDKDQSAPAQTPAEPAQNVQEDVAGADADQSDIQEQAQDLEGEVIENELDEDENVATESLVLRKELDTVLDAAAALESVSNFMHASAKNGTYNPVSATFAGETVKRALATINQKTGALVALESDADQSTSTSVAIVNNKTVKSFIANLVRVVRENLSKAVAFIKERTARFVTMAGRVKARAEGLLKTLGAVSELKPVNSPRIFAEINIGGKVERVSDNLNRATEYMSFFASEGAYKHLVDLVEKTKADDKAVSSMNASLKALSEAWRKNLRENGKDGEVHSSLLPGNVIFSVTVPSTVDEIAKLKSEVIKSGSGNSLVTAGGGTGATINPIDVNEAKLICNKIIAGIKTIEGAKFENVLKDIENGLKSLESSHGGDGSTSVIKTAFAAISRLASSSVALPFATFTSGWLRIANSHLNYVEAAAK